jgi:CRISPR-associated protein Cmr3
MKTWIIEPRDPLIVRDGKPFDANPGARATTLAFPFPSTTTGGVRTRAGLDNNGVFDVRPENIARVKEIAVRGPLLVELMPDSNEILEWLVPAPADALLLEAEQSNDTATDKQPDARRKWLVPIIHSDNIALLTNLPKMSPFLVGQVAHQAAKPIKQAPKFWYWKAFKSWLLQPAYEDEVTLRDLGHSGPTQEVRTHVRIQPDTQVAQEGYLFQTRGLEFTESSPDKDSSELSAAKRLALAVMTDSDNVQGGFAALGGERRMVSWREGKESNRLPATCPTELVDRIKKDRACRVILLTPAWFEQGWQPDWLFQERVGVTPELQAVALQRPQIVSGWDFEQRAPKKTRRLVAAGSVFFLKLNGEKEAIGKWIETVWLQCISDDEIARHDGFGLAVVGVWDGKPQSMRLKGAE